MFQFPGNQPVPPKHLLHQADRDVDALHHDLSLCRDSGGLPQRYDEDQSCSETRCEDLFFMLSFQLFGLISYLKLKIFVQFQGLLTPTQRKMSKGNPGKQKVYNVELNLG